MILYSFDAVIVGAGVIGLCVARELAMQGQKVLIVEKRRTIFGETSSRNSEVLHAGLYYGSGTRKFKHCTIGRQLLLLQMKKYNIDYRTCGKLVVSTAKHDNQKLEDLFYNARDLGVPNLRLLSTKELKFSEENLRCNSALLSPDTAVFDTHSFGESLLFDVESNGGMICFNSTIIKLEIINNQVRIELSNNNGVIVTSKLVNAAGLNGCNLLSAWHKSNEFSYRFLKGNYFIYNASSPFTRLIYPLPDENGLGIHSTIDLSGNTKFGPDTDTEFDNYCALDVHYNVQDNLKHKFYDSIVKYFPNVRINKLQPGYSGFRPKLYQNGLKCNDFHFKLISEGRGIKFLHILGIESPGLTSSMSIALDAVNLLD